MGDIALFGLSGSALVYLIVQAAKVCKLPSHWAPIASLAAGFVVALAYAAHKYYPAQADPWIEIGAMGLVLGLGASGLQSQGQTMQGVVQRRRANKALKDAPAGTPVLAVSGDDLPATGIVTGSAGTGATTRLSMDEGDMP